MKIVIKPIGAFLLLSAILVLAIQAYRNQQGHSPSPNAATVPSVAQAATPSAVTTETAPTTPAQESKVGHAIFRDHAENGWDTQGWTWAKDIDFSEKKTVYAGTTAIRVAYNGYDGLKFHHDPLDTHGFDRITFCINGGPKGGQHVQVGAICAEKDTVPGIILAPLPAKKWTSVTIPLTRLSLQAKPNMTAFWIQGNTNGKQDSVYIDEVRLLKPNEPAPAAPPLAMIGTTR